jgi:hypothetical protein
MQQELGKEIDFQKVSQTLKEKLAKLFEFSLVEEI